MTAMSLVLQVARDALAPAMALLPAGMDTPAARRTLMTICLQESGLTERRQRGDGPARGLAQFERGGGVVGVMTHPATSELARRVIKARGHKPDSQQVWAALEFDDVLALALGRLLLWTDHSKMPTDEAGAWLLYLRTWRPGKPHPERWPANWAAAMVAA